MSTRETYGGTGLKKSTRHREGFIFYSFLRLQIESRGFLSSPFFLKKLPPVLGPLDPFGKSVVINWSTEKGNNERRKPFPSDCPSKPFSDIGDLPLKTDHSFYRNNTSYT